MRQIEILKNWVHGYRRGTPKILFPGIYKVGPHIDAELADRAIRERFAREIETKEKTTKKKEKSFESFEDHKSKMG